MKKPKIYIVEAKLKRHWSPDGYSRPTMTILAKDTPNGEIYPTIDYNQPSELIEYYTVIDDDTGDKLSKEDLIEFFNE